MNLDDDGHVRGAAFVEFVDEVRARNLSLCDLSSTLTTALHLLRRATGVGQGGTLAEQSRAEEAAHRRHGARPPGTDQYQVHLAGDG